MPTRQILIDLTEQVPQARTIKFLPDLTSADDTVVLSRYYKVTTDATGVGSIALPTKASGTIKYRYEIPKVDGVSKGYFFLSAGSAIELDDLIAAGGEASDSVIDYVDEQITEVLGTPVDFAMEFLPEQDLDPPGGVLYLSQNVSFGKFFEPTTQLGDCWWEFQFMSYPTNTQGVICDIGHGGSHPVLLESLGNSTIQHLYGNMYNGTTNIEANGKDNFEVNTIHHAVYAVFGQVLYLYLDGVMTARTTFTGTRTVGSLVNDGWLYLGASGEHQGFYGKILRARAFEESGAGLPFASAPGAFTPERVFGDVWNSVAAVWNVDLTRPSKKVPDTSGGYNGVPHSGYRALSVGEQNWPEAHLPQYVATPYVLPTYSGTPSAIPSGADIYDDFYDDNQTLFYNFNQTYAPTYPSIGNGRTARVGGSWLGPVFGMPVIGMLEGHAVPLGADPSSAQIAWMPTPGGSPNYRIEIDTGLAGGASAIIRYQNASNYIEVIMETTQVVFHRIVAGAHTFVGTGAVADPAWTTAIVEADAGALTVTVGGSVVPWTEVTLLTGINVGFGLSPLQRMKKIAVFELAGPAPDISAPTVPSMTAASGITDTEINWNWAGSTDDVAVTGYDLQIAEDAGFSVNLRTINLGLVLTYEDTGLDPSTQYFARVRAHDAVPNNSAYSSSGNATTTAGSDSDAEAFLAATGIVDPTITDAINTLVTSLKAASLWAKCGAIYPLVGGTAATNKWNLKDPQDTDGAFRLTFTGGVTHSASGFLLNGTTGFANTHIVPSVETVFGDEHLSLYSTTNNTPVTPDTYDMGSYVSFSQCSLLSLRNGAGKNQLEGRLNGTAAGSTNASAAGHFTVSKVSAVTCDTYKDGAVAVAGATSGGSLPTNEVYIGGILVPGLYGLTNQNYAFATYGSGLTAGEASDLYDVVQAFQTALGRQV